MKIPFISLILALSAPLNAEENTGQTWNGSTLSEATITKVQAAKTEYQKCVAGETQKPGYLDKDSRKATEDIMKLCEPSLGKMREVYLAEKVPGEFADRHLRQVRIQTTRQVLQELIFQQAARGSK